MKSLRNRTTTVCDGTGRVVLAVDRSFKRTTTVYGGTGRAVAQRTALDVWVTQVNDAAGNRMGEFDGGAVTTFRRRRRQSIDDAG